MKKFIFYAKSCKLFFQRCGFTVFEKSFNFSSYSHNEQFGGSDNREFK